MFDDVIYTVTAGHIGHNNWRCWAWFATLEEAQQAIKGCGDFFWENYYEILVIEEVPRASITPRYREWWYGWNVTENEWQTIDKPSSVETLYHFGVG